MATTRAFAVFRDEPEAPSIDNICDPRATTITVPPPSGPLLVYAPDKENVDPTTGSRVIAEQGLCKKRKTALVAKSQPVSPSKKPRPLAEKPVKKTSSKSRSADKKPKRVSAPKRSTTRTRKESREPSLPRLAEEGEESQSLEQIVIDAKCKELTVLPLADISEAYEQAAPKEDPVEDAAKAAEQAAAAAEEKAEEVTIPPSSEPEASRSPAKAAPAASTFSTPERKRIYSAFTFSSPCASGDRFASTRSSVERFSDAGL